MADVFISSLYIKDLRNIHELTIPLSTERKKNLIITGKNGAGKTSLLRELKSYLGNIDSVQHWNSQTTVLKTNEMNLETMKADPNSHADHINAIENNIRSARAWIESFGLVDLTFNDLDNLIALVQKKDFITAYLDADRSAPLQGTDSIQKTLLRSGQNINDQASTEFIKYLVSLKADRSFAKDDRDETVVADIDEWFAIFEKHLFELIDSPGVELAFDRKTYNFNLIEQGKAPYNLSQLSGGYSAILTIVGELIMRMEEYHRKSYDAQGVVLIDEIETHLHVDLQKKIFPFLTSFFPEVQFIVTTHSPFVLNSVNDAVICDLEKKIVTEDLSGYSYDTLVESYFGSSNYSEILLEKVKQYDLLMEQEVLSEEDNNTLSDISRYLDSIPKFISDELAVAVNQIKLRKLKSKKK